MDIVLDVKNISKNFKTTAGLLQPGHTVAALKNVSFEVAQGEILAVVGESGSGKSTLIKIIQGLLPADQGQVLIKGKDAQNLSRLERARLVQTVFQDPYACLNPKHSVATILSEALTQKEKSPEKLIKLLQDVGLDASALQRYPHQFSGGQRQRIGIARALASQPSIILADEPVSALDVSVQSQILNLILQLNKKGTTFLLVTHDLSVVRHLAHRVLILDNGSKIEENSTENIFKEAQNLVTKKLFAAITQL